MRLSVIIPAYNHLDKVLRCLNSLDNLSDVDDQARPQFIISDDASPDYDLRTLIPRYVAETYRNPQNLGFNGNVNAAASHAIGDLIAIVNQDVFAIPELSQDWDTYILNAFDEHPDVGIVGPRLLRPGGTIQSAGGEFDAHCQPTHRYLDYSDITHPSVNTPEYIEWITGAFFVVRRDVWGALGGFDPIYAPSYFEDCDFCLRAREAGWKTWYEPRATFVHEVGSTGGSPHFMTSAKAFHARWVASGKIKPSIPAIRERWW